MDSERQCVTESKGGRCFYCIAGDKQ
jgi:hypothetical protein